MQSVIDMGESSVYQAIHQTGLRAGGRAWPSANGGCWCSWAERFGPPTAVVCDRLTTAASAGLVSWLASRLLSATDWDDLLDG